MPHIIIETSKNILASESLKIGQEIQQIMKKIVEGNFDPDQCKIRVINYENYIVGLEENDENFIHISIKILAGRAVEVRQKLTSQSFEFVNNFYKNLKLSQKRCDISIDIIEMNRETYQKITLKK
jgi:5-carboxymethyl-2-hydroxymuconate isomerase